MLKKSASFLKDVRNELAQVSWPSREELLGSTRVIFMTVVLLSMVIGIIDLLCARLMSWIIH